MPRQPSSLACLLAVACATAACSSDPCDGKSGTCLAVTVTSATVHAVDTLDVTASGAASGQRSSILGASHTLPVQFAVMFASDVSGTLRLDVVGRLAGDRVGVGNGETAIVAGRHSAVTIPIDATTSGASDDMGGGGEIDMASGDAAPGTGAPRLVGPMSGSWVTSPRPSVHWELASGTTNPQLQFCVNRQFTSLAGTATVDVSGTSGRPDADLPAGVVYWRVVAMTASGPMASSIWSMTVPKRSAANPTVTAAAWGHVLDVNGDGYADLAVTAPGVNVNGAQIGRIYVFTGSSAGIAANAMPAAIDGLDGALSSPTTLVASGGDVNGDGYADLLYRGGSGHAYVFNGGPNGIANMAAPSVMLKSVDVIAGAGDVDGDGYGDVVVANLGTVSIYYGTSGGLSASARTVLDGSDANGGTAPAGFGGSVAAAGDVNADGFADIIVGATNQAFVYLGGKTKLTPLALTPGVAMDVTDARAAAGIGDINSDGYPDIIVSGTTTANKTNAAFVFLGGATQMTQGQVLVGSAGVGYANCVNPAGDSNADGLDDVVVGAPFTPGMTSGVPGAIYWYQSTGSGLNTPQPQFGPSADNSDFGAACAGGGDFNADGYSDFVVAAPPNNSVWLFATGVTTMVTTINGPVPGSFFGSSVAQ